MSSPALPVTDVRTSYGLDLDWLVAVQRAPERFIERRVETLDLVDDRYYHVKVLEQFSVPSESDASTLAAPPSGLVLIPLGSFSKVRRPDLVVRDPDGAHLPTLVRAARASLLTDLFLSHWREELDLLQAENADQALRRMPMRLLVGFANEIIKSPPTVAHENLRTLVSTLTQIRNVLNPDVDAEKVVRAELDALLSCNEFWSELTSLGKSTTLFARMTIAPGQSYVVNMEYSERFVYEKLFRPPRLGLGKLISQVISWQRWLFQWLGLIPSSIIRTIANGDKAQSLWVVVGLPDGVEILRFFWRDRRFDTLDPRNPDPADPEGPAVECDRAVVGRFRHAASSADADQLIIDAQVEASSPMSTACGLALIVWLVSTLIYRRIPGLEAHPEARNAILAIATFLAILPAAIAGALAYRSQTFARYLSRGPRVLVGTLSGLGALLAVLISLRALGSGAQWIAYVTSVYSFFLLLILLYVRAGPRFRKNERSRIPATTRGTPPEWCRRLQRWAATTWFLVVLVATGAFAKCQLDLRTQHLFAHHFFATVWHTLWS